MFTTFLLTKKNTYVIQWAPLNGITLGQRETDSNNGLFLTSHSTKHTLGRKWKSGIFQVDKFDPINRLIPLSVIPLSGAYCN